MVRRRKPRRKIVIEEKDLSPEEILQLLPEETRQWVESFNRMMEAEAENGRRRRMEVGQDDILYTYWGGSVPAGSVPFITPEGEELKEFDLQCKQCGNTIPVSIYRDYEHDVPSMCPQCGAAWSWARGQALWRLPFKIFGRAERQIYVTWLLQPFSLVKEIMERDLTRLRPRMWRNYSFQVLIDLMQGYKPSTPDLATYKAQFLQSDRAAAWWKNPYLLPLKPEFEWMLQHPEDYKQGIHRLESILWQIIREWCTLTYPGDLKMLDTLQNLLLYDEDLKLPDESIVAFDIMVIDMLHIISTKDGPAESLRDLASLRSAWITDDTLTTLPDVLGDLTSLQKLYIKNGSLATLPDSIGALRALTHLVVWSDRLATLPDAIGQLRALERLWVRNTELAVLPLVFDHLQALELWVKNIPLNNKPLNKPLKRLPESIGNLTSLQILYLEENQLTALPGSIGRLHSLQTLNLTDNQLTTLPDSIGDLKSLQTLYLYRNQLTALPDSFGHLASLKELYLSGNRLNTLPDSFGELKALERLWVRDNQLTALPEMFGQLNALKELFLEGNQIARLPESFRDLSSLRVVYLRGNPLARSSREMLDRLYCHYPNQDFYLLKPEGDWFPF